MKNASLRSLLSNLPREHLTAIADKLGLSPVRDLIPQVVAHLERKDFVADVLRSLPPDAFELARDTIRMALQREQAEDPSVVSRARGFAALQEHGLLFVAKDYWGGLSLVMPTEAWSHMSTFFLEHEAAQLNGGAVTPPETISTPLSGFLRNVATVIAIAEDPGLQLTQEGEIAKRFAQKRIVPFLEADAERGRQHDRYSVELFDVWNFCIHLKLLERKDRAAVPTPAAYSFLSASAAETAAALELHLRLRMANVETGAALRLLAARPDPAAWCAAPSLVDGLLGSRLTGRNRDLVRNNWMAELEYLADFGYLESGLAANGTVLVRPGYLWRESAGAGSTALYVTPDFRISAPANLDLGLRHRLFRFARFLRADRMDQWEITRASIGNAVDAGVTAASILETLSAHAATPLPKNVEESVRLWAEDHEDVRFHFGPMLIVRDPAEQRIVRSLLEKEKALTEEPGPGVFILRPGTQDRVLSKIQTRRSVNISRARPRETAPPPFGEFLEALIEEQQMHRGFSLQVTPVLA